MSSRLRRLVVGLLAVLVGGLLPTTVVEPAAASVTLLCKGYAACAKAGMSASGYGVAGSTSWWRMYTGHNCTNYAAYRMVQSGLPNVRPWSGGGNATYWGTSMPAITDGTPAVGAVAWWKAYAWPAGSAGHVAYVERVVSADEIIVSQDSWGGDFSWARITRGSGWPTGFIHFNDASLVNLAAPTLTGVAKVGAPLTVTPGTWDPGDAVLSYRWRANGTRIAGATAATFVPTPALRGKRLTVRVVATRLGYPTTSVVTTPTPAVLPGELSSTAPPTITGEATVDATLAADPGRWSPEPDALAYRWSADGVPIPGADAQTLLLEPALVGKSLTVTVTATRAGYADVAATSVPTGPVAPGTLTVTAPPTLAGEPRPGQTLTVSEVLAEPAAASSIQWLRSGVPVPEATGPTYQLSEADLGARVAARVTLTRPGYDTVALRTPATPPVRSVPTIRTAARSGAGRLVLDVTVTAPGADPVAGALRLRSAGRLLQEVAVRDGAARFRVTGLAPGPRVVRLVLPATATVARGELERRLVVG